MNYTGVDITVTEADSVHCPPTSCEESQEVKPEPDTSNEATIAVSSKENKEDSTIKTKEKLPTQKDDISSQEVGDGIQNKNDVSLKKEIKKEPVTLLLQEEEIKGSGKTKAVECDKLTVEDVKEIVKDTKKSHINIIKEVSEDANNVNKETVVVQKEGMKVCVGSQEATELEGGIVKKQEKNDEGNKLEQDITKQKDTPCSEEHITPHISEDVEDVKEHMQMEQDKNEVLDTCQSEETIQEDNCSMETEQSVVALVKEPIVKMEDEPPRETDSTVCAKTSDTLTESKDTVGVLTDASDLPTDVVTIPTHNVIDIPEDTGDMLPKNAVNTLTNIGNISLDTSDAVEIDNTHVKTCYSSKDASLSDMPEHNDDMAKETADVQIETSYIPQDNRNALKLSSCDDMTEETGHMQTEAGSVLKQIDETLSELPKDTGNGLKLSNDTVEVIGNVQMETNETLVGIEASTGMGEMTTGIPDDTQKEETDNNSISISTGGMLRKTVEERVKTSTEIGERPPTDTPVDHTQRDTTFSSTLLHKENNTTTVTHDTPEYAGYTPAVDTHKDTNDEMKTVAGNLQTEVDDIANDIPKQTDDTHIGADDVLELPDNAEKDTIDKWKLPDITLLEQSDDTLKQKIYSKLGEVYDIPEQAGNTLQDIVGTLADTTGSQKQPDDISEQSGSTSKLMGGIQIQEADVTEQVYFTRQGIPLCTGDTLKQTDGMPEQPNDTIKQMSDMPVYAMEHKGDKSQDIDDTPIDIDDTHKQTEAMQIEMILVIKEEDMVDSKAEDNMQEVNAERGNNNAQSLMEDKDDEQNKADTVCQAADGIIPTEACFKTDVQVQNETFATQEDSIRSDNSLMGMDDEGEIPALGNALLLLQGYQTDVSVEENEEENVGAREETCAQEMTSQLQMKFETKQGLMDTAESSIAEEVGDTQTANNESSIQELSDLEDDKESLIPPKEEVDLQTDGNEESTVPKEDIAIPINYVDIRNHLQTGSIKESREEVNMQTEYSKEIIICKEFDRYTEGNRESIIPKEEQAGDKTESIVPEENVHMEAEGDKKNVTSGKNIHMQAENTMESVIPKEDVMQIEGTKEYIIPVESVDMETEDDKKISSPKESTGMGMKDDNTKNNVIPKEDVTEEQNEVDDKTHEMSDNEQGNIQDTDSILSTISDTTLSLDQDDTEDMMDAQDPEWMIDDKDDPPSSCESTEETQDDSDTVASSQVTVGGDSELNTETLAVEVMPTSYSTQLEQETFPTSTSGKEATPTPVSELDQQTQKQVQQATSAPVSNSTSIAESCEAEGREMIKSSEELECEQALCLAKLASDLLEQWSDLKEVYRIPKRSSPPPVSN